MKLKDLLLEARSIASEVSSRITERVLKQAISLKPEYISLISKTRDIYDLISRLLDSLNNIIRENTDTESVLDIGKNIYLAFHSRGFYIIRSKPFHIILSYNRDNNELCIKTKKMNISLTPDYINASVLFVKTSIELNRVESFVNNYREFKYIINYMSRILDKYLVPIIEARVKIAR